MGICQSLKKRKKNTENGKNNEIERYLANEKVIQSKQCKILLLGSGESGKSTILKQMKIINLNGYTRDELFTWRPTIYRNVVECAQSLIQAMRQLGINYEKPGLQENVDKVLLYKVSGNPKSQLSPEIVSIVKLLWQDTLVKTCFETKDNRFYIMDSARHFLDSVERIGQASYVPNEQDVLRARLKTTGITEIQFPMGELSIHMFDVGGQRSERKKWIHCFDNVTSVIFCIALSEYDQVLLEESNQNRMIESLALFESIVNSRWFVRSSVMLFLNKVDVFKAKLAGSPLERYFPDYEGGANANKAAKYILWRFLQCNRNRLTIYPHLTQATNTSNIRFVFTAIKETLLRNALQDSGML